MTDATDTPADWLRFEAVVRSHDRDLRAFAGRLLAGTAVAVDDVLQDAYLEAFRASTRGGASSEPIGRAHLFRLVHWRVLDALRSDRRGASLTGEQKHGFEPIDQRASTADQYEATEEVAMALAALSLDARSIVLLVDGAGFSYAETAELLDIPEGTVASRLHQARSRFRTEIKNQTEKTNA
jgi:RNA polymerase sigma-70 factor (ECF subfamily)